MYAVVPFVERVKFAARLWWSVAESVPARARSLPSQAWTLRRTVMLRARTAWMTKAERRASI